MYEIFYATMDRKLIILSAVFSSICIFSSKHVGAFHLATVRSTNHVVLQTSSQTVVVTPNDPEIFVEAVKARFPEKKLVRLRK